MKSNLLNWSLVFAITATFSISALAQGGPLVCGKGAGYSHAAVPTDVSSTAGGHSKIGSLAPSAALEDGKLNASLMSVLEKNGISVPGGDLKAACSGFKDLTQCIATMHVAKNLNAPFASLQSKMTGSNSVSIDQAIQGLEMPDVNAKNEAKKAKKQTNQDLKTVESGV